MGSYSDKNCTIAERVEDLLSRMSLPQKVAQLHCIRYSTDLGSTNIHKEGVGEVTAAFTSIADQKCTEIQDIVKNKTQFGIPAIIPAEALSGVAVPGATIFASPMGLGATWNPDIVEEMADIIRKQMVALGIRHAFSPVMDVARDPRWGRISESYGEDPTLCAAMSVAFTKGLQGKSLNDGVIATSKHFLGYGLSDGGLNQTSNPISPRELREVFAKPFQAAITEGELQSVMNSYGSIDGELICKSKSILTELLRDEMAFDGFVVSDYSSIQRAVGLKVSKDAAAASVEALKAGLDVEFPYTDDHTNAIIETVQEGLLDEEIINRSARRVLTAKFRLGLFENSYPRREIFEEAFDHSKTYACSLKTARESIVLLKNAGVLPLSKHVKNIAVIGPHADSLRLLFGGYTSVVAMEAILCRVFPDLPAETVLGSAAVETLPPYYEESKVREELPKLNEIIRKTLCPQTLTIFESIKKKCPESKITYERGCDIAGTNRKGFAAAMDAARNADVVILTLGGKSGWGEYCTIGEGQDCDDIGLPGIQEEFAMAILNTGKPVILVHMDGRPLASEFAAKNFPAIIEFWSPGDSGGQALADVLFGDYNPAGRMPATAARNAGQIPIHAMYRNGDSYAQINSDLMFNNYVDGSKTPLFYFGEGQSYTSFEYSNLRLDKSVKADGVIHLSCDVTNTGSMDGEEVVQVYVSDELASMIRPFKELAGFKRVPIGIGKTKTIHFEMRADQFAFLDADMKWIVEAGAMIVRIGASSEDIRLTGKFEIEETRHVIGSKRGFFAKAIVESK